MTPVIEHVRSQLMIKQQRHERANLLLIRSITNTSGRNEIPPRHNGLAPWQSKWENRDKCRWVLWCADGRIVSWCLKKTIWKHKGVSFCIHFTFNSSVRAISKTIHIHASSKNFSVVLRSAVFLQAFTATAIWSPFFLREQSPVYIAEMALSDDVSVYNGDAGSLDHIIII